MNQKTNPGRFFEDYSLGDVITHATPRTITEGDRALYQALYPSRFALSSSDIFAQACGLPQSPVDDLIAFHIIFGKTVPDISLNAVANLGYAECRFLERVYPGATLSTTSEVIGLKQNSNGKTGIVWVHSIGRDETGDVVVDFKRWVMVRKRDASLPAPESTIPDLAGHIGPEHLHLPSGLDFQGYDITLSGDPSFWNDYEIGEKIDHVDGVTMEEAEHMMATRLWQNTAKVHFDATQREDGKRLIYGGHIISIARALSFNGLGNAQFLSGINSGSHVSPAFAGDTVRAWSEVLDKADTSNPEVGALRLRLVAYKALPNNTPFPLKEDNGKYDQSVLLDLDYWALMPKR